VPKGHYHLARPRGSVKKTAPEQKPKEDLSKKKEEIAAKLEVEPIPKGRQR